MSLGRSTLPAYDGASDVEDDAGTMLAAQRILLSEMKPNGTSQRNRPLRRMRSPAQEESEMLVLSRKPGERILIGSNIELMVVEICGNKVRLSIDAPREISIHRQEVFQRIQNEIVSEAQREMGVSVTAH